jgi:hypothetical protein
MALVASVASLMHIAGSKEPAACVSKLSLLMLCLQWLCNLQSSCIAANELLSLHAKLLVCSRACRYAV